MIALKLVAWLEPLKSFVTHLKVPDNLSHFSRHDLAYFEARSSIFLYMSHVKGAAKIL